MYNNNGTKQLIIIKNYNYVSRSNEKKYSNYVTQVSDNHIIIVYVYIFFLFTHNMPVFGSFSALLYIKLMALTAGRVGNLMHYRFSYNNFKMM